MLHQIPITFSLEAPSREAAYNTLSEFLKNPCNPNRCPSEIERLPVIKLLDTICITTHCQEKTAFDSGLFCEEHYCRPGEGDQQIWSAWFHNGSTGQWNWSSRVLEWKVPAWVDTYAGTLARIRDSISISGTLSVKKYRKENSNA